jgi:hypothetical protein
MNKDLGVWTADDCALVLIDYRALALAGGTESGPARG